MRSRSFEPVLCAGEMRLPTKYGLPGTPCLVNLLGADLFIMQLGPHADLVAKHLVKLAFVMRVLNLR